MERLDALVDIAPRAKDAQGHDRHGQDHHQQADTIDPEIIGYAPGPDPPLLFHEPEPAAAGMKPQ